jgi:hypothetical protein
MRQCRIQIAIISPTALIVGIVDKSSQRRIMTIAVVRLEASICEIWGIQDRYSWLCDLIVCSNWVLMVTSKVRGVRKRKNRSMMKRYSKHCFKIIRFTVADRVILKQCFFPGIHRTHPKTSVQQFWSSMSSKFWFFEDLEQLYKTIKRRSDEVTGATSAEWRPSASSTGEGFHINIFHFCSESGLSFPS